MKILKSILIVISCIALCSCTVVTYNRSFPSLSWYWSNAAKEQRAEKQQEKQWENSQKTNSISQQK